MSIGFNRVSASWGTLPLRIMRLVVTTRGEYVTGKYSV